MTGTAVSSRLGGGRGPLSPCAGPAAATLHQVRFIFEADIEADVPTRPLRAIFGLMCRRTYLASSFGAKLPQGYSESGKGDAAIKSQALGLL